MLCVRARGEDPLRLLVPPPDHRERPQPPPDCAFSLLLSSEEVRKRLIPMRVRFSSLPLPVAVRSMDGVGVNEREEEEEVDPEDFLNGRRSDNDFGLGHNNGSFNDC